MRNMENKKDEYITGYFDFETYNITNYKFGEQPIEEWDKLEKTDKPVAVYGAGLLLNGIAHTWFGLDALDNFWNKLKELGKGKKITLIAHNCAYDFAFINEYINTNPNCKVKKIEAAQTDDERSWLWARIKVDGLDIKFLDTWIWDKNCSLAWYAEIIRKDKEAKGFKFELTKNKLEDYEKWNVFEEDNKIYFYDKKGIKKELDYISERQYLLNDISLLPEVKAYIYNTKKLILGADFVPSEEEWIHPFRKLQQKITKASFSKACLELCSKKHFYEGYKTIIEKNFYLLQEKSFIGGFTAGNKNITRLEFDDERMASFDVNSLYPSIMAGYLPWGDISFEINKNWDKYCEWFEVTGTYCKYKEKYDFLDCPIISEKFEKWLEGNKDIDSRGYPPTFLILKDYFELINEFCDNDLKIIRIRYQELSNLLSDSIKKAYDLRVLVKHNNKPLADSIKLFLNSGFGKLSEKTHYRITKWNQELKCWEKIPADRCDVFTSLLGGLYVCTQGRIKLMKAIKSEIENGNTFLYSDTDSIKLVVNNPVKLHIDPDELGAWKDEGRFTLWAYPAKRKRYYCYNKFANEEKIACGGFNKKIIDCLTQEKKLIFFSPNTNTLIKQGKRARYIGSILDLLRDKKPDLNRYGLTKLFMRDISTTNTLKNPDYIIFENNEGKWIMEKANNES